jgi:hypothetical protein
MEQTQEVVMEAYRFETKIQKDGTIRIPEISGLADRSVELFIVMKPSVTPRDAASRADHFLNKWTGVIQGADVDQIKKDYLQEKYA